VATIAVQQHLALILSDRTHSKKYLFSDVELLRVPVKKILLGLVSTQNGCQFQVGQKEDDFTLTRSKVGSGITWSEEQLIIKKQKSVKILCIHFSHKHSFSYL
jgi:hypothetical protein